MTAHTTTRVLTTGINGRGQKVWIVESTTTRPGKRTLYVSETFSTEEEALCWLRWA
jgi:hypothetical protein